MSEESLDGKAVIVTGSGKGIGRAVVEAYAKAGARVCVTARTEAQISEVAESINGSGGKAIAIPCDVTDAETVKSMVDQAAETFGGLDMLFANAGGNTVWDTPIEDILPEQWQGCVDVNLTSAFYTARAAIPHLKKRGAGKIIFTGSGLGHRGVVDLSVYSVAKAGLWHFTRLLAEELLPFDITVNELVPGIVHTKPKEGEKPERKLVGQLGGSKEWRKLPEDVVPLAMYLATTPKYGPTGQSFSLTRRWL
ncbi:MAG: SDR family NAD(P)-dependent oxidoreductase [Opitutales bacterium]|nr:SDR family oxidoreductase [bacterium]MDG2169567.1 SDR family NAD(P)-dependent oxidoreductase [Opitutales bacterium]